MVLLVGLALGVGLLWWWWQATVFPAVLLTVPMAICGMGLVLVFTHPGAASLTGGAIGASIAWLPVLLHRRVR